MLTSAPAIPHADAAAVDAPWPRAAYAWYVTAVLMVALAFAILDRTIISLIVDPLRADLHISDAQIGLLQGLAFAICYASFGLVLGVATDRMRRRPLLCAGILVWSLSTMACGYAGSFGELFAARVGVGFGEATIMPVAASLISDYFPADRRVRAFGLFQLGVSLAVGVGNLLGGVIVGLAGTLREALPMLLGAMRDWQIIFLAVGAPGCLLALWFFVTVREPVRREITLERERASPRALAAHLGRHPRAYAAVIGGAVLNFTTFTATSAWLASVFIRVHGWTPMQVGAIMALMSPIGMSSSITVGLIVTWLAGRGRTDGPLLMSAAQSFAQAIGGALVCFAHGTPALLAGYTLMLLAANWTAVSALTALSQITPNTLRGQTVALYGFLTGVVSLTIGTWAVGFLSDRIFPGHDGVGISLVVVLAGFGLPGAALLLWGRAAFRRAVRDAGNWQEAA